MRGNGRIMVIWDPNIWSLSQYFTNFQFIHCKFLNKGGFQIEISFIYASNSEKERSLLWNDIKSLNSNMSKPWIIIGDFNTVFHSSEKRGGIPIPFSKLEFFNNFFLETGLIEPSIKGNQFTWKSGVYRNIHCKLDRILINHLFVNTFPNFNCYTLPQATSDHTPLLINFSGHDNISRNIPFRFVNGWTYDKSYKDTVKNSIISINSGSAQSKFKRILKNIKVNLKNWNKNRNRDNIKIIREECEIAQNNIDFDSSDKSRINHFFQLQNKLCHSLHVQVINMRQQAKVEWLTKGDESSKFFYAKMTSRKKINDIGKILDSTGATLNDVSSLENMAINYFSDLYNSNDYKNDFPNIEAKFLLNESSSDILLAPVELVEIKKIIFESNIDKSPGPDGFGAKFYKTHWEDFKNIIHEVIKEFFTSGKLLKSLNHTFITLVPKVKIPSDLGDYRPIACCNFIYKIIASILSNRIKNFLKYLISENQCAFIPGRQIIENSLLAHELIRNFNRGCKNKVCIKIDIHKAFDKINRHFIIYMMRQMGFHKKFCDLVKECIDSASFSILVNGSPCGFISSNRGIRQGDPLSPYLFTIAMEYFSIQMELEQIRGNLRPVNRISPSITHLLYADDLLIFMNADINSVQSLAKILEKMENIAGLQINESKSKAYFSKNCANKGEILQILKINEGQLPVKYLGLPLSTNQLSAKDCSKLIDIIQNKIENWSSRLLSIAGRLELVHTVITAIIMFWIQTHNIPKSAICKIERICANFLWKGKNHKISWDTVCKPKEAGGLGLRNINDLKEACSMKLFWKLIEGKSLWAKWMICKYAKNKNFWTMPAENHHSHLEIHLK
jgi:hypothetical protein